MYKSILAHILSVSLLLATSTLGTVEVSARLAQPQDASVDQAGPLIPNDQLDSLVAPIALYPDPLLSQVLVASTYPLELIQLQQWIQKNSSLKGDDLTSAVQQQDWDPSILAMSVFPDLVKRLTDDIKWTTDLGNAFLAQQSDVMDAVQRMRKKALDVGQLKSSDQQKVETKTVETKTVVVIQPASTQVVYVPMYNPVIVYGPPIYPYPPIYYPPPGYYGAGVFIGFGVGVAYSSYYRGGWGYSCAWGYSRTTININVNNNYIRHYNTTNVNVNRNNVNVNNVNQNAGNTWQHNPQHRGGTPYSNKATATKYGGTTRGDSMSTRQASARQQQGLSNRPQPNASNLGTASANRPSSSPVARPSNPGTSGANRPTSNTVARDTGANRNTGNGNNIGNRQISTSDASLNKSAFGGTSSKASAQATSARGASSMASSRAGASKTSGGGTRRQ